MRGRHTKLKDQAGLAIGVNETALAFTRILSRTPTRLDLLPLPPPYVGGYRPFGP